MDDTWMASGTDPDGRTRVGRGGKLARSETVTVRLDPKLRYLADLAALKQRRTVSSFIEFAIEENLATVNLIDRNGNWKSLKDAAPDLWDVDEADRFAKLAFRYPDLLNHTQQVVWKLILENGYLWRGSFSKTTNKWTWPINEGALVFERLRQHWEIFNRVARGEVDKSALPTWPIYKSGNDKPADIAPMDDEDIPF